MTRCVAGEGPTTTKVCPAKQAQSQQVLDCDGLCACACVYVFECDDDLAKRFTNINCLEHDLFRYPGSLSCRKRDQQTLDAPLPYLCFQTDKTAREKGHIPRTKHSLPPYSSLHPNSHIPPCKQATNDGHQELWVRPQPCCPWLGSMNWRTHCVLCIILCQSALHRSSPVWKHEKPRCITQNYTSIDHKWKGISHFLLSVQFCSCFSATSSSYTSQRHPRSPATFWATEKTCNRPANSMITHP